MGSRSAVSTINSTAFSDHKFQSRKFSSGGYKWRLIVYPKGNQKDNGSGFISMYVEIDSKSLMVFTPPTEIFAELHFFVYNKKENKYFTIQDVEVKRFNALRTVWGLVQVLPYDTFNNPENGYVFEGGQCEFGVDVIQPPTICSHLQRRVTEKERPQREKLQKTLKRRRPRLCAKDSFKSSIADGLRLYPKGDSRADGKWLSVYLELTASDTLKEDEKIFVQANLRVLDPLGSNHIEHKMNVWCEVQKPSWGWYNFMSLAELQKAYLDNKEHALNLEMEFKVVSATS
ncbi:unnamed protein product [Brassica napus]|uniref:(rape) hypothetical protein n=1 Tax=Brassica napus TaxID=3708 RepID=A0A816UKI3_BRANA|nr:unnamed protein product [Brassica napus]